MNWTLFGAVVVSVASCIGAVISAVINRRPAHMSAKASERQSQIAEWAAYATSLNATYTNLLVEVQALRERLEEAEQRSAAVEARAERAEKLYKIAINYLRQLIDWAQNPRPGRQLPGPPAELRAHL